MTVCIPFDTSRGRVLLTFDGPLDESELASAQELAEWMATRVPALTSEQIKKQEAARARTRERIARITGER